MTNRLRQTVRSLTRSPGFTGTAIATLAAAIGINAAIFSILHAADRSDGFPSKRMR